MRLVLALCLCLLSFAPASSAEQTVAPDGFSICILDSSAFGPCQPLSEATIASFHLSGEEQQIARQLKRLVVSSDQAVLDDLAKAFAPPRPPIGTTDFIDLWFPDRRDPQVTCFICGLHLKFAQQQLVQINYGVTGQFMIIWNRVMMTLPPR
jgi:hypothetical protein